MTNKFRSHGEGATLVLSEDERDILIHLFSELAFFLQPDQPEPEHTDPLAAMVGIGTDADAPEDPALARFAASGAFLLSRWICCTSKHILSASSFSGPVAATDNPAAATDGDLPVAASADPEAAAAGAPRACATVSLWAHRDCESASGTVAASLAGCKQQVEEGHPSSTC